jgi:hypothetical protein
MMLLRSSSNQSKIREASLVLTLLAQLIVLSVCWKNNYCRIDQLVNGTESFIDLYSISSASNTWSANYTEPGSGVQFLFETCNRGKQRKNVKDYSPCRASTSVCIGYAKEDGKYLYSNAGFPDRSTKVKMIDGVPVLTVKPEANTLNFALISDKSKLWACQEAKFVQSTIRYKCGTIVSEVQLISAGRNNSDVCQLEFEWKSKFACPTSEYVSLNETEHATYYDSERKISLNLKPIIDFQGHLNTNYSLRGENYTFFLNPSEKVLAMTQSEVCKDAFICQAQNRTTNWFTRALATRGRYQVYKLGDELHLKVTSRSSSCGKNDKKNVTVIMRLLCSNTTNLTFHYESSNCDYIFDWESEKLCFDSTDTAPVTSQVPDAPKVVAPTVTNPKILPPLGKANETKPTLVMDNKPAEVPKSNNKVSINKVTEPPKASPIEPVKKANDTLKSKVVLETKTFDPKSISVATHSDHGLGAQPELISNTPDAQEKNRHIGLLLLVIIFVTSIFLAILLVIDDTKRFVF